MYSAHKRDELRQLCKDHGLPVRGLKSAISQRLEESDRVPTAHSEQPNNTRLGSALDQGEEEHAEKATGGVSATNELGKPSTKRQSIKESESVNTVTLRAKVDARSNEKSRNSSAKVSGKTATNFNKRVLTDTESRS